MNHHSEIVIDQHFADLNPVQFGFEDCLPSHYYGPAVRTHWLLHYVISGEGRFIREGETHRVGAGDIFVIPPYLETYYQADANRPWRYIWIGFTATGDLPALFQAPVLHCPAAGTIFEEMKNCSRLEAGRSAFLAARLWELTSLLLEQGNTEIDYVKKAIHCIRSEYMISSLTVQSLADRLGLDRSYFSALFKERTGLPPVKYLIRYRMERAAELMLRHGERPSTVAPSVGYPDLYHFSKLFKAHFGLSPREYVKQKKNAECKIQNDAFYPK